MVLANPSGSDAHGATKHVTTSQIYPGHKSSRHVASNHIQQMKALMLTEQLNM